MFARQREGDEAVGIAGNVGKRVAAPVVDAANEGEDGDEYGEEAHGCFRVKAVGAIYSDTHKVLYKAHRRRQYS